MVTGLIMPDMSPPVSSIRHPEPDASIWKLFAGEQRGAPFSVPERVTVSPCLQQPPTQEIDGFIRMHSSVVVVVELVVVVVVDVVDEVTQVRSSTSR
jgi:hypothetical protein